MDRISGLSDELILKILLFVPTKVAVSTSVLSKRWENLWMWLPKLDYSHISGYKPDCKRLQRFLNKKLPSHRAPVIESFRLELHSSHIKPEYINIWVVIAVFHCLRELDIVYSSYPSKPNIVLPSVLFYCKSLVILNLEGDIVLDVPRMVSLPSLKTLKLQRVRDLGEEETLQRLLSNCPVLDDLVVDLRDGDTTRKLTAVVPSLQSLSICMPCDNFCLDELVIETPSLKYFELRFPSYNNECCLTENMPYLIEAHIDVDLPFVKTLLGSSTSLRGLIGSITSVKRLTICSKTMLDEGFVFNQLEHLEVCLCTPLFPDQLFRLLKASSKLKRLDISLVDDHLMRRDRVYWNQPTTDPECLLSSLQSLSWSLYTGKPQERDIVAYILKHALHLKTATIKSSESAVPKLDMLKELSLSSRGSPTCQLMFE